MTHHLPIYFFSKLRNKNNMFFRTVHIIMKKRSSRAIQLHIIHGFEGEFLKVVENLP